MSLSFTDFLPVAFVLCLVYLCLVLHCFCLVSLVLWALIPITYLIVSTYCRGFFADTVFGSSVAIL